MVMHSLIRARDSDKMMLSLLLSFCIITVILQGCYGQTIINVPNGVYSIKAESDGLHLPSTSTYKPIGALTIQQVHILYLLITKLQ